MSKTIKEIADELGVSKTAVRKKIANLFWFPIWTTASRNGSVFLSWQTAE